MKKKVMIGILISCVFVIYPAVRGIIEKLQDDPMPIEKRSSRKPIHDKVVKGETVFDIFKKHKLSMEDLSTIVEASEKVYSLHDIDSGQQYSIAFSENSHVDSFVYWIDDDSFLKVEGNYGSFRATKCRNPYEEKTKIIAGTIKDNLISAVGSSKAEVLLALRISDIFAWDIDFTSDLRRGDTFTIVAEGFYLNGSFEKYGEVLSAEFNNNGEKYLAYRYSYDGKVDYYDERGNSLRKAFLKAPLSFRRISSNFSGRRFHPVLKTYRPHRGVDYAAAQGTPVSATGDGIVLFAGHRLQYGKLVVLRHRNGYSTYYGHLSRIKNNIRRGAKVSQGDVIGYVGATGLATGPHLHYEMRHAGERINPLTVELAGNPIPGEQMSQFEEMTTMMDKMIETRADESKRPLMLENGHKSLSEEG